MRLPLVLVTLTGLAASIVIGAQPGGEAKPATATAQPVATAPAEVAPPNPKAIPVPDMPVVKKTELADGLVAEDMKLGEGYEVAEGGSVVVHYHGMLKEGGKVFDSSYNRGEPIAFPLGGVIPGWQKGVPGMKVGGIRKLTIPSKLAYGERGAGADIPPNSDLVFIIQVIDAVQSTDVKAGDGEVATAQCVAVTTGVVKDADGKEIAKYDAAHPYIWFPGELQGIEGMKVGGTRSIRIPKEFNQANPGMETGRPTGVTLSYELQLNALRNLPRRR